VYIHPFNGVTTFFHAVPSTSNIPPQTLAATITMEAVIICEHWTSSPENAQY
jgi:hypothetical protein